MQLKTLGPDRYKINNLMNFGGRFIYNDNVHSPKLRLIQEKVINKLIQHILVVVFLAFLSIGTFVMDAFYLYFFEGIRSTILGFKLPFSNEDSENGFLLNNLFQCPFVLVGLIACSVVEISAALIINVIASTPSLIHFDLEELETELIFNGFNLMAKARLRNVFVKIQDYEKYIHTFFNH